MPDTQTLHVFYGTVPILILFAAAWIKSIPNGKTDRLLLKDIVTRLGKIEDEIKDLRKEASKMNTRLAVLGNRFGVVATTLDRTC